MSETTTVVSITIGTEATREISGVMIQAINLGHNYMAQAPTAADQSVTVLLRGAESVINALDPTHISAFIDLSGLTPGTHTLPVIVRADDVRINVASTVSEVNVVIRTR